MRGLAHIGALEVLQERGLLKAVKEYIGISAGSFCAFAICIGCTLSELRTVSALLDFSLMQSLTPETAFRFLDTFGFDSGENLERLLTILLKSKGLSPDLTFGDLAARPHTQRLRVFATDLNTCLPVEFSATKSPGVQIIQALRASMSIPIYFTPVTGSDGHLLVDGGVITHVPFSLLSRDERETTLNITFRHDHLVRKDVTTLPDYLAQIYGSLHKYHYVELEREWHHRTVFIPCGDFPSTYFQATTDEKMALMDSGRTGMEEFLDKSTGRPISRRFSVV